MSKIVMLENANVGRDVDLSKFNSLGDVVAYNTTLPGQIAERLRDAEIAIINKMPMNEDTLSEAKKLKMIAVMATGMDNVDLTYCAKRGIYVKNVSSYSTMSVVQHTFALLFYLYEKLPSYDCYVKNGNYTHSSTFSYFEETFHELNGKTWGIVGLGEIGKKVANVAKMFGCEVLYFSTSGQNHCTDYQETDFDTLLEKSDIISIHAPLNNTTRHLFTKKQFIKMKNSAYLINVGRGPIVSQQDLYNALQTGEIAGAALDVLEQEPMSPENPLLKINDSSKLLITPHIAWATVEARRRLMDQVFSNVSEYLTKI